MTGWMQSVDLSSVYWLLPLLFMFHDFEEILTVERWGAQNRLDLEASLPRRVLAKIAPSLRMTTLRFAWDVLYVYIIVFVSAALAVLFSFKWLYLAVLAVFFLHAFSHMFFSAVLRRYTPGVVTAVCIVLPYSLFAYARLMKDQLITLEDAALGGLIALVLLPGVLALLLKKRANEA